ncbi:MAG: hypothetical protein CM15mP58_16010 [Burkholderiaceae bacterium]|nr:MAG: hypothetical protein CM15mP58_16010 [Burkholderiaceae bacterium]
MGDEHILRKRIGMRKLESRARFKRNGIANEADSGNRTGG